MPTFFLPKLPNRDERWTTGFRLNESDLVATDGHDERVSWSGGQLSQLPREMLGQEVVLVFELLGAVGVVLL